MSHNYVDIKYRHWIIRTSSLIMNPYSNGSYFVNRKQHQG